LASKTELTTKSGTELTQIEQVPEFLKSHIGQAAGLEDVEQSDILIPRLGLCQALSPQKRKSHASYIEGLKEGDLFNTVTQEVYGSELEVVLLFFFKNRIKYFPIDSGGGIDCISPNGIDQGRISPDGCSVCRYSQFGNGEDQEEGKKQSAPECTMYHNLMAFITSDKSPIAISFKSTGLKVTKQLLAQIRMSRLPMYAKKYTISVVTAKAGQNEWFEKRITPNGFVDATMYAEMEKNFEQLKAANVKVDTTGEGDESFNIGNEPYHTETEL
jgi:hypothetical protein